MLARKASATYVFKFIAAFDIEMRHKLMNQQAVPPGLDP